MIKHIVLWRLKDHAMGASKKENAEKLKALLEALRHTLKEIKYLEVGINADGSPHAAVAHGIVPPATLAEPFANALPCAADVALYSEFLSWDDLAVYQKHPDHLKIADFVQEIRLDRHVVDYEV